MNRTDIDRLAREAGATPYTNRYEPGATAFAFSAARLDAFVALVEAADRERWAKFLENHKSSGYSNLPHELAAAIRANKDES